MKTSILPLIPRLLVLAAVLTPGLAVTGVATAQIVPTPRATALPISVTSRPFLQAQRALQPVDLAARGYTEEEYLVSGNANIYDWAQAGARPAAIVRTANVPYATRILIRRPLSAAKFSGRVVVELLNPTGLYDFAPLWGFSYEHFLRQGDVWVGVTIKPVTAAMLQRFDATRYAKLNFAYRQAPDCQPAAATSGLPPADLPTAENGLAWDITAQVGALLRSSSKENPLVNFEVRRLIAAGYSQTGGYLVTYVNALHSQLRLGTGAPVYDAYVDAAGAMVPMPINQCAAPLPAQDPRRRIGPRDAPVITVMTQTDFALALDVRRQDSDTPEDFFRLYEIAGAAHSGPFPAGLPAQADLELAGLSSTDTSGVCEEAQSNFPSGYAFNAMWMQLDDYLVRGTPMAHAAPISVEATGRVAADAYGNAVGGLRLPQLAVPLATYGGSSKPKSATPLAGLLCSLTGSMRRFDSTELKSHYGTRAEYLKRFNAAVDEAVTERWLVPVDAAAIKAANARTAPAF